MALAFHGFGATDVKEYEKHQEMLHTYCFHLARRVATVNATKNVAGLTKKNGKMKSSPA